MQAPSRLKSSLPPHLVKLRRAWRYDSSYHLPNVGVHKFGVVAPLALLASVRILCERRQIMASRAPAFGLCLLVLVLTMHRQLQTLALCTSRVCERTFLLVLSQCCPRARPRTACVRLPVHCARAIYVYIVSKRSYEQSLVDFALFLGASSL